MDPQKSTKPCRYGEKCRNIATCRFAHPPTQSTSNDSAEPVVNDKSSRASTVDKKKRNRSKKGQRVPQQERKTADGGAAAAAAVPIQRSSEQSPPLEPSVCSSDQKSGPGSPSSQNAHQDSAEHPNKNTSSRGGPHAKRGKKGKERIPKPETTSKKSKPCRYGAKCYNPKCAFMHPDGHVPRKKPQKNDPNELVVDRTLTDDSAPVANAAPAPPQVMWVEDLEKNLEQEATNQGLEQVVWAADLESALETTQGLKKEDEDIDLLLEETDRQRYADAELLARDQNYNPDAENYLSKPKVPITDAPRMETHQASGQNRQNLANLGQQILGDNVYMDGFPLDESPGPLLVGMPGGKNLQYEDSSKENPTMNGQDMQTVPRFRHDVDLVSQLEAESLKPSHEFQELEKPSTDSEEEARAKYRAVRNASKKERRKHERKASRPAEPVKAEPLLEQPSQELHEEPEIQLHASADSEEEARAKYRAARNAAKKERRKREKDDASRSSEQVKGESPREQPSQDEQKPEIQPNAVKKERRKKRDKDNSSRPAEPVQTESSLEQPIQDEQEKPEIQPRDSEDSEEARAKYRAARNAAKKERRRLEREAKAMQETEPESVQEPVQQYEKEPGVIPSTAEVSVEAKAAPEEEDEEDRKRRWQQELRLQKERAAAKKKERKEQKEQRHESFLRSLEVQTKERSEFWQAEIENEQETVNKLEQLCLEEFCRTKLPGTDRKSLVLDDDTKAKLEKECQKAFRTVCKLDIHSRVGVKGLKKQQDLNDRTGTIENWDESKGKFYVGLDTKKGRNVQYMYFLPGNLEALPSEPSRKAKAKDNDRVFVAHIFSFYGGEDLTMDIYRSDVKRMKKARNLDSFLTKLMSERDEEEREAKRREEEERRQEEEARQRRAEARRRENERWEQRQREYEERKQRYEEWRREERKSNYARSHSGGGCNCPACEMRRMFAEEFLHGGFYFHGGRGSFFFRFADDYSDDDDYYSDDEDEWDRQWNRMHEEDLTEQNANAAELLGVDVEAPADEIKRVYRRKALKYHPDKYRTENHSDGMTKEEAEEHFKELTNAYDHLMSNFD